MEHVLFAGYKIPHPLEPRFVIKIQTDNESTPIQAVQEACAALINILAKIQEEFMKECDTARAMGGITSSTSATDTYVNAGTAAAAGVSNEGLQNEGVYGSGAGLMDEGMGDY